MQARKGAFSCYVGVVYKIPLSCGCVFTGLRSRCINDRMREHANSLRGAPSGHLTFHCNRRGCKPVWNSLSIVGRYKDKGARGAQEAFLMHRSS